MGLAPTIWPRLDSAVARGRWCASLRSHARSRPAILTPECSARWDGRQLTYAPGAGREDAPPADADERLWLTYYENIFNPARLKLSMMQKET